MTKEELYSLTINSIKKQEEEEKRKTEAAQRRINLLTQADIDNTIYVYDQYIMESLRLSAEEGKDNRTIRLIKVKNRGPHCYRCVQAGNYRDEDHYNTKLQMYYYFPTFEDGYCDLDYLLQLLTDNEFLYNIIHKPLANSKASKYYEDEAYIELTIYWGKDENWQNNNGNIPIEKYFINFSSIRNKTNLQKERNKLSAGLRYDILKRDGFRCQICGRSAADGVKLHVDHKIPISKGGLTTWDNLRTLCQDCNLGKSNKIE